MAGFEWASFTDSFTEDVARRLDENVAGVLERDLVSEWIDEHAPDCREAEEAANMILAKVTRDDMLAKNVEAVGKRVQQALLRRTVDQG